MRYFGPTQTEEARTVLAEGLGLLHKLSLNPPKRLYHYTPIAAVQKILTSQVLWATAADHLNDASELIHGVRLARKLLDERIASAGDDRIKRMFGNVARGIRSPGQVFVTCFCAKDDLLSQWRGYGASGGGYSLEFYSALLTQKAPTDDSPQIFSLERVIYRPREKRAVIESLLDMAANHLSAAPGDESIPEVSGVLSSLLGHLCARLKHSGFEEEDEWRLICTVPHLLREDPDTPKVLFRPGSSHLIPYVELKARAWTGPWKGFLPVTGIRVGPTARPRLAEQSLRQFTESLRDRVHLTGVGVVRSKVPLRLL